MRWRCPICSTPTDLGKDRHFPFCSERCRWLDLGNWANGKYRISQPVVEESPPEQSERDRDESKS
ncbi:MAG TPA: DNA gyrase inhibitor YacG [Candidatus Cybelea sp.]|nr:DNA gyrase inhibitor YacG [Candidatus Cybelea sp.]